MPDPRDTLELSLTSGQGDHQHATDPSGRPWLGIFFRCANLYTRAYRSPDGTQYLARCPRCGKTMTFTVGPRGSDQRRFELSC